MMCTLCGNQSPELIRTTLRHDVKRNVFKCPSCSFIFLEPKELDADQFYGHDYRGKYTPVIGEVLNSRQTYEMYLPFQQARIDRLGDLITKDAHVLDIGCSAGHFLATLKPQVAEVTGIEYNRENAEFVNKELGIKVYTEPIEKTDIAKGSLDLITMFQVFEHVTNPQEFLQSLLPYLKPTGSICIEVPNVDEALLSVYESKPFADFSFREPHVFYYSPKTLPMMAEKAGYTGKTRTIQRINFLNHVHWIMTGQTQKGPNIHMTDSKLVDSNEPGVKADLNQWMKKVDQEYADILNKYGVGESVLFIGQKKG